MLSWLQSGLTQAGHIMTWILDYITTNEVMQIYLVLGIVPVGFHIFASAKNAVSGD